MVKDKNFHFTVSYEEEDGGKEFLDYPFRLSYKYNKYNGETFTDTIYYNGEHSSGFEFIKEFTSVGRLGEESIEFTIKADPNLFEEGETKVFDEELMYGYNLSHDFVLTPKYDKIEQIIDKFGRTVRQSDILLSEYERVFGNSDVLIIWQDGKVMNLKHIDEISTSYETEVTDKNIDLTRLTGDSYFNKKLNSVEVTLEVGDVWSKEGPEGIYKKQNRSSVLSEIYNLYENNIPLNFRSDVINIDSCFISSFDVSQTYESDNTYEMDLQFTEIDFISKLPQTVVYKDKNGDYEERPADTPVQLEFERGDKEYVRPISKDIGKVLIDKAIFWEDLDEDAKWFPWE